MKAENGSLTRTIKPSGKCGTMRMPTQNTSNFYTLTIIKFCTLGEFTQRLRLIDEQCIGTCGSLTSAG